MLNSRMSHILSVLGEVCGSSLSDWKDSLKNPAALEYLANRSVWEWYNSHGSPVAIDGNEKATVIILNYKRPANIEPIVRSLLRATFVNKIIVSNNNPAMKISDVVKLKDHRLDLRDEPGGGPAGTRFEIAAHEDSKYFIAIDDDLFLHTEQVATLFQALIKEPAFPHGICGEVFTKGNVEKVSTHYICNGWGKVDIVNRFYAFTKDHIVEFFRLLKVLNFKDVKELGPRDDLLLSFSGSEKPLCHIIGNYLSCWTNANEQVAVYLQPGFTEKRRETLRLLQDLKKF